MRTLQERATGNNVMKNMYKERIKQHDIKKFAMCSYHLDMFETSWKAEMQYRPRPFGPGLILVAMNWKLIG
jgi:hypothetical protein